MSLFGALFSGVTGLNGQSRSMAVISENIANMNTVGYKANTTQFSTLLAGATTSRDMSTAGVVAKNKPLVHQQGQVQLTDNATDLAITGDGFFVVTDSVNGTKANGETMFTRAGSFQPDAHGNFVNSGGFYLLGWRLDADGNAIDGQGTPITPDPTFAGQLQTVNMSDLNSSAKPTTQVRLNAGLPVSSAGATFDTSVRAYDTLGIGHPVDFTFTKLDNLRLTAGSLDTLDSPVAQTIPVKDAGGNTHDLTFTYSMNGPGDWTLDISTDHAMDMVTSGSIQLLFDGAGNLTTPAVNELEIAWAGADVHDALFRLDLTGMTENTGGGSAVTHARNPNPEDMRDWKLTVTSGHPGNVVADGATGYVSFNADGTLAGPSNHTFTMNWDEQVSFAGDSEITLDLGLPGSSSGIANRGDKFLINGVSQDGLAFGNYTHATIDSNGRVVANFDNGVSMPVFQIPLAMFNNPNGLAAVSGNAYKPTIESGGFTLALPEHSGAGAISSSSLEASTVDFATEFTRLIVTQRAYSASANVITTSDRMLEELSRIGR